MHISLLGQDGIKKWLGTKDAFAEKTGTCIFENLKHIHSNRIHKGRVIT